MIVDEEDPTAFGVEGFRRAGMVTGAGGPVRVGLAWVVPVGIVGTAAEWLTRTAGSVRPSDPDDLYSNVSAVHVDLHEVFGEAAAILGLCRREQRYVLADAAMSLFAAWLVECGKVTPAAPDEGAHGLVHHWVVERSLWTVTRELSAAANVQRLRRLAAELGEAGLGALLRAEVACGTRVSGAALALRDYARSTGSKTDGTRR